MKPPRKTYPEIPTATVAPIRTYTDELGRTVHVYPPAWAEDYQPSWMMPKDDLPEDE